MKRKHKDNLTAFLFLTPTLVVFIVLVAAPVLFSIFLSFTDWNFLSGFEGIKWVGLSNFSDLLEDRTFIQAVGNTFISVSYTHLDVYKRQLLDMDRNPKAPLERLKEIFGREFY